jgi:glutathione S-transferase
MERKLYELCAAEDGRLYSPYCWRTRMALAHKGLDAEFIPWRYSEVDVIKQHGSVEVPVLLDGKKTVFDSWAIASYLEDAYPERPSLFGGEGGRALGRFINAWADTTLSATSFPLVAADVWTKLRPEDQPYFRRTRELRLGRTLEEAAVGREVDVEAFRKALTPLRQILQTQPFFGGNSANYGDYIVFGIFQWARAVSPFKLLKEDDPVFAWRERLLDAFDGMPRKSLGYPV